MLNTVENFQPSPDVGQISIQFNRYQEAIVLFFRETETSTVIDELLTAYSSIADSHEYDDRNLSNLFFTCKKMIVLVSELERVYLSFKTFNNTL